MTRNCSKANFPIIVTDHFVTQMLRYHFGDGIINCHVEISKAAQWTVSNFSMIRPGINTATSATVITCVKIVLQKFVILRYNK